MRLVLACLLVLSVASRADYSVIVMGDWGGMDLPPFTTPGEIAVAQSMDTLAAKLNTREVLALGDNFYSLGVTSEYDIRFDATFEKVFTGANMMNSTFHVLGGNHDHYGNVTGQLEYTKHSTRWSFPSLYYTFTNTFKLGDHQGAATASVQFVMINTVLLAGNTDDGPTLQPPGPKNLKVAEDEWSWIESTLKASTADYLIVAGHYPVWSVAEHGPTTLLVQKLKPLLEKYKVTAYLCGHDHNEQHIDEGTGVDYHVIGAAHLCDTSMDHEDAVPKGSLKFHWAEGLGGFGSLTFTEAGMVARHYDQYGNVTYTAPTHKPRSVAIGPQPLQQQNLVNHA